MPLDEIFLYYFLVLQINLNVNFLLGVLSDLRGDLFPDDTICGSNPFRVQ